MDIDIGCHKRIELCYLKPRFTTFYKLIPPSFESTKVLKSTLPAIFLGGPRKEKKNVKQNVEIIFVVSFIKVQVLNIFPLKCFFK